MNRRMAGSTMRVLSVVLVLALLVLVSGFASAQPRAVTTLVIKLAKLTASDGAESDQFGYAVSISGDTVVVGARFDGAILGSAYVYERDAGGTGKWGQVAKLTASDGSGADAFGSSVSISGDTVVVSATGAGLAYLFEKPVTGWGDMTEVAKLTASDWPWGGGIGESVSISGDTVLLGAHGADGSESQSGSAYLFEKPGVDWADMTETAKLTASDGASGDEFGIAVSISGDTAVVGAWGDDDNGVYSGSAYVYERDSGGTGNWGQVAKLTASDGTEGDRFGYAVSISGDTVVAGAFRDDAEAGSAYLFEKPGAGWGDMTETAKLTASDGAEDDNFGWSVSISGSSLVVGAQGDDDSGDGSGSAYLFEKPEAGWDNMTETAKLTASDGASGDEFGIAVSISGNTLAVGAYGDDDNGDGSGSAYVFLRFEPVAWVYLPVVLRGGP